MTAIVGMLCKDGVVIGSDSSSTFSTGFRPTIEQSTKKVHVFHDCIIVAGTGAVGLGQRFCHIVDQAYASNKVFNKNFVEVGTTLAGLTIQNFNSTSIGFAPDGRTVGYGALMAYTHQGRFHLCEFATTDFQPEFKTEKMWYVSMGSGQPITDPFLGLLRRVFDQKGQPSVAEASFYVAWTLQHAIDLNTGGINGPVQIAVIKEIGTGRYKAEILSDCEEHMLNVKNVEKYLGKYENLAPPEEAEDIPAPNPSINPA